MRNKISNIWIIASKDIWDAFHNKLVVSIVITALVMLAMPKWLGAMLASPENELLVYAAGDLGISETLEAAGFSIIAARSEADVAPAVRQGVAGAGLVVLPSGSQNGPSLYINWGDREKLPQLEHDLGTALGGQADLAFTEKLVYPEPDSFSLLGVSFLTMLVVILIVGINLVPALIFEEKQTKTLDALLVSPATEGQLVAAKALVGLFYTLLVAVLLFGLNWNDVVHWELSVLFTLFCGLFSVSVGLVIGSFYQRQQDATGISSALVLLFIGGIFVRLVKLSVPQAVGAALDWLPSTWLFRLLQTVFYQAYTWQALLPGMLNLLAVSFVLLGIVVWKLRRSDR